MTDERELQIRSEMLSCKFFNGIGSPEKQCEAGVCYRALVGGDYFGWVTALPCTTDRFEHLKSDRPVVPCEKYTAPTYEEATLIVDERNAMIADTLAKIASGEDVPNVIVCGARTEPEGKECPRSVDGRCPECGGVLDVIYGLDSGYGGIGAYSVCMDDQGGGCGRVCDFVPDEDES